jgi:hypothetical protein
MRAAKIEAPLERHLKRVEDVVAFQSFQRAFGRIVDACDFDECER